MAETLAYHLDRHALGEQQRGVGVAQVVKPDHRQPVLADRLPAPGKLGEERAREPLRVQVPAVVVAELFAAWAEWCRAEGEDLGTQTAFSLALTNRGFDKRPTKAANVWTGLGLANE